MNSRPYPEVAATFRCTAPDFFWTCCSHSLLQGLGLRFETPRIEPLVKSYRTFIGAFYSQAVNLGKKLGGFWTHKVSNPGLRL